MFTDNRQQDVIQKQRSVYDCSDDGPVLHVNAFHIETFRVALTLFTLASFLVTRNLHVTARFLGTLSINHSFGFSNNYPVRPKACNKCQHFEHQLENEGRTEALDALL